MARRRLINNDLTTKQPPATGALITGVPGTVDPRTATTPAAKFPFLDWQHPVYEANVTRWLQNEVLLQGGDEVLDLLRPFEWELPKKTVVGEGYWWRKQTAVYPMLPDKFATLIAGHLSRSAPKPDQGLDFGTLGKVGTEGGTPTQAELVFFSCDTPGITGMPWDPWWEQVIKRSLATGHRWIMVVAPPEQPANKADERLGKKPYLRELSPTVVPSWYVNLKGQLEYAVITVQDLDPKSDGRTFVANTADQTGWLVLVRKGCTRLGPEFVQGGWFQIDAKRTITDDGRFDSTKGEIPLFPLYYETSPGTKKTPAISRPGTTELGNCAIALMNTTSAANFDAWDGAKGIEWLRGVDLEAWKLAMAKQQEGSRWLPLPPNSETDAIPAVSPSSAGQMASDVFTAREKSLWDQAQWLGVSEAVGGAKTAQGSNADFSATQMPRIVQVAMHVMAAQNMAIYFLEQMFGHAKPAGQAIWPTKYNLVELASRVKDFFEAERLSGLRCTPLDTEAMLQLAVEKGLVSSEQEKTQFRDAFLKFGEARDLAQINAGNQDPGSQDPNSTAPKQAARLADQKVTDGSKGTPGRPTLDQPRRIDVTLTRKN